MTILDQIFEKIFFEPQTNFWSPLPEKTGKKRKKWHFWDLKGKLTCELQVKITLFYYKMVNSVMALQIWSPKIIFWHDFRPILFHKLVKWPILVSYGLNLVIWRLFRLWRSLDYPFPWSTSWEMMQEAHLKDSTHQKIVF